jgi:predicted nucleic acid-binding protein
MLLDSSAWVEFFQGAEKWETVGNILKTEENFTSAATFAELTEWCLRNNRQDMIKDYINAVKNASRIIDLEENIIIAAGRLNYERKKTTKNWGMMDSFILATSLIYNLKILTKDSHFRDLENAEML